jgi:hypothetical protein
MIIFESSECIVFPDGTIQFQSEQRSRGPKGTRRRNGFHRAGAEAFAAKTSSFVE